MVRRDRQLPDDQARQYLRENFVAHVGTVDAAGWPYVVPLMYVYEGGDRLYLHTGPHHGHFLSNIGENSRVCVSVDERGPMHRGSPAPCDSAQTYSSVIAFGQVRVYDDADIRQKKTWFFDRLLERLNEPKSAYEDPGYPMLDRIILYEVSLEIVTGKKNVGLRH